MKIKLNSISEYKRDNFLLKLLTHDLSYVS